MNPFELLKALFNRTKPNVQGLDLGSIIAINQWLSLMPACVSFASSLIDYIFYIKPEHYYYLLYFGKYGNFKFVPKPKRDMTQDLLLNKLQYILDLTDREMRLNLPIINETILKDTDKWCIALGVG